MPKPKIMIGVPGFQGIQPEAQEDFMRMIFRLGRDMPEYDFIVKIIFKSEQFRARNRLVDAALAADAQYLLMLDDDMLVPHDLIQRLLAHNKDVVGALYWQRGGSFHPVVMKRIETAHGGFHCQFYAANDPIITQPGLHPVDIIGGGCMFFKMDVFRKILPPYFWWEHDQGTDIAICTRLGEAGVPIYIDTTIELGHIRSERDIITRDGIPLLHQAVGAMKEELQNDARAFFSMSSGELESAVIQAGEGDTRREMWHQEPRDTWESVKRFYQENGEWHVKNLVYFGLAKNTSIMQWMLSDMRTVLPPGSTILDLGPGVGVPTFHLASTYGYKVIMGDIEQAPTLKFLGYRAKLHHLSEAQLELREFADPVPNWTIQADCVTLISMLDHCWDAYGTLEWATQQVKPGGLLICDYETNRKDKGDLEPQHLITYDQFTIPQWLYERGFDQSPKYSWLFTKRA